MSETLKFTRIMFCCAFMFLAGLVLSDYLPCAVWRSYDTSFFQQPDVNSWPGDMLSAKQFYDAVNHFKVSDPCHSRKEWALVGSNQFLLKGTDYMVIRVPAGGEFVPNVHWTKGIWGGTNVDGGVPEAMREVEYQFREDCLYGGTPARMMFMALTESPANQGWLWKASLFAVFIVLGQIWNVSKEVYGASPPQEGRDA